tara:strand:- start:4166 stop:4807 length:642 start_codon:yes stop_codon:yes gene_type:complete
MVLSGYLPPIEDDEEEEEEEKEIPYNEKNPLKRKNNTNKEPNTELLSVLECTPNGNVFMKYNLDNESFDYWSDYKEIPFQHLETVARKYVNIFNCADLYLCEEESGDREEDSDEDSDEDSEEDSEEDIEEDSEESEESEEESKESSPVNQTPPDDEIFAKFKNTEKMKEIIQEETQLINKFRYKGKLVDILEFKQRKKEEPKDVSFSSWKGIF